MKVLILANGTPPSEALLRRLAAGHDLLIATDGAVHAAALLGVAPDIVSGDFDSARLDEARAAFPNAEFIPTPDQHHADLEKALQIGRDRGADSVTITGAGGGRIDHTLGNLSLLWRYGAELPLAIVEEGSETRALLEKGGEAGAWTVATRPGDTLSLLSLDGLARITVRGVRWPLEDFQLPVGTQGISNRATGLEALIEARGGILVACHLFPAPGRDR